MTTKFSPSEPFWDSSDPLIDDDELPEDWSAFGAEDGLDDVVAELEEEDVEDVLQELTGGARAWD